METSLFLSPTKTQVNRHQIFLKTWFNYHIVANVLGMGFLHIAISHTITGPHGVQLTSAQWVAHTISLLIFSFILNFLQNKAWQLKFERGNFTDLGYYLVIIPAAFWLGYYTLYIPFDILFMYLAIGGINAIRLRKYFAEDKKWAWQILLALLCGALVGIGAGFLAYYVFLKDMKGLTADFVLWFSIALPASITYAGISKFFLQQHLKNK